MPNYDAEIERESIFQAARDELFRVKVGLIEVKKECQWLKEKLEIVETKLLEMSSKIKEKYDV